MRDPRLVEIDFLMDLEVAGSMIVRTTSNDETSFAQTVAQSRYGLDAIRFRDLIVGILLDRLIVGPKARGDGGGVDEDQLRAERFHLETMLTAGHPMSVVISHRGRIRLWDLRDQLQRDPDLEPMGL